MTNLRQNPISAAYEVELGEYLESYWGKELGKMSKRFPNNWSRILKGLIEEYKVFDISELNGGKKYNILSSSSNGKYRYYKIEVKFYPNKSASSGGCRVCVFVNKNEKATIVFACLHEHLDSVNSSSSEKKLLLNLLKKHYGDLYELLEIR